MPSLGKCTLAPLTSFLVFPPQVAPEAISSVSLRNISWRAIGAHFKDHRAPGRVVPLVFCEAVETGAFFSSLRHTSHGARLTGIEISGREVWMSRCALLRSRDVSVVSKRVISENVA